MATQNSTTSSTRRSSTRSASTGTRSTSTRSRTAQRKRTPAQRSAAAKRAAATRQAKTATGSARGGPGRVTGFVKRSDGRGTLWIDGVPREVTTARASSLMNPAALAAPSEDRLKIERRPAR